MSARFGTTVASLRNAPPLTAQDTAPEDEYYANAQQVEVENQFVLRLPEEPAQALREALRSGSANVRDRLKIQLEPENASNPQLRRGRVVFDGWSMHARLMDLPTIVESAKTIDGKTFYKTADICQMLVCREGEPSDDDEEEDEETAAKKAKKAAQGGEIVKVDKKYVYRHGLCPPLKNCRRRRFRKTLRKKNVEAPEVEKEVRRLLRLDTEAVDVRYELVTEEELKGAPSAKASAAATPAASAENTKMGASKTAGPAAAAAGAAAGGEDTEQVTMDLFGALSDDSDEESANNTTGGGGGNSSATTTPAKQNKSGLDVADSDSSAANLGPSSSSTATLSAAAPTQFNPDMFHPPPANVTASSSGAGAVSARLDALSGDLDKLRVRKQELERNIANCDNQALLLRFRQSLVEVEAEMVQKEEEADSLAMLS